MSDTPQTDSVMRAAGNLKPMAVVVNVAFARQLERELAASKSELEQFKKREAEFPTHHSQSLSPELRSW